MLHQLAIDYSRLLMIVLDPIAIIIDQHFFVSFIAESNQITRLCIGSMTDKGMCRGNSSKLCHSRLPRWVRIAVLPSPIVVKSWLLYSLCIGSNCLHIMIITFYVLSRVHIRLYILLLAAYRVTYWIVVMIDISWNLQWKNWDLEDLDCRASDWMLSIAIILSSGEQNIIRYWNWNFYSGVEEIRGSFEIIKFYW